MISLIVSLALVGFLVWAVTTLIPMPAAVRNAIYVVAVVCVVAFALQAFGLWRLYDVPVPQVR